MKRSLALSLALSLGLAGLAQAKICTMDQVPAATLLLPYFEVDLGGSGINTMLTINNASPNGQLAKVEVFSDLGVAIFGFTIYLSGYDQERIDLWNVIGLGQLPQTAPPSGIFPSCNGFLPLAPLSPAALNNVQQSLTGGAAPLANGLCAGVNHGDHIARGYVTVDVVSACTLQFQGDPGYWASGGMGVPTDDNLLWGDFYLLNRAQGTSQGGPLVHVEASATDPETSTPGQYTFYGKYVNWTAADNREPLGTTFGVEYLADGGLSRRTDLLVWRDPKVLQNYFTCPAVAGRPSWYPLGQELVDAFDDQERSVVLRGNPFPEAAQRTAVGSGLLPSPALAVPFTVGWMYLNLNTVPVGASTVPPEDSRAAQAWVIPVFDAGGIFNTGYGALQYDSACQARHNSRF